MSATGRVPFERSGRVARHLLMFDGMGHYRPIAIFIERDQPKKEAHSVGIWDVRDPK